MTTDKGVILVTGVTGQQGGATARHLLAKGWHVRALVRDLRKPAVQTLRQAGAEVVQGDLDDPASLAAAIQGVYGVYSVQAHVQGQAQDETRQGQNVADAAKAAGIQHLVYSSVQSAEELFHVGANISKWEIEQHIRALALPATILRPTGFMDDLIGPWFGVLDGTFAIPLNPDVAMQLIAVDDIGAFAALAFEQPDRYIGKTIDLAGDAQTPPQIAAAIARTIERPVAYVHIPLETVRQQNIEFARVCEFFNNGGYKTDITAMRAQYPNLTSLATWLQKNGKAKFEELLRAQERNRIGER